MNHCTHIVDICLSRGQAGFPPGNIVVVSGAGVSAEAPAISAQRLHVWGWDETKKAIHPRSRKTSGARGVDPLYREAHPPPCRFLPGWNVQAVESGLLHRTGRT